MAMNGSNRTRVAAALLLLAPLAAACSSGGDRVLDVDAEGTVIVFLYRDDNLNAVYNSGVDRPVENAHIDVRISGALNARDGGETDTTGFHSFRVAVGRYVIDVANEVLGDSLEVTVGSSPFTVGAGDSVVVPVALAYGTISITEARALSIGETAWVRGILMNSPNVFGDSTVHMVDDSAAIRTIRVRPGLPLLPGDSALFLGRRLTLDGQPVLEMVAVPVVQGVINPPPPDSISTATAATAGNGSLDARYAKVAGTTVSDTATVSNVFTLSVDDGSGKLTVVLSPNVGWGNLNQYRPDTILDIAGLLVPDPLTPGRWVLKPRSRQDITIVPPTT